MLRLARSVWVFYVLALSSFGTNALPRTNDLGIPVSHIFDSSSFPDTDDVCQWLWSNWSTSPSVVRQTRRNKLRDNLPVVLSHKTTVHEVRNRLAFFCYDNRLRSVLQNMSSDPNQAHEIGPFFLQCHLQNEQAQTVKRSPDMSEYVQGTNYRLAGVCMQMSPRKSPSTETIVRPGTTNCIDAEANSHFSQLSTWIQDEGGADGNAFWKLTDQDTPQWMSLTELGGPIARSVKDVRLLSVPITHELGVKTYRACAHQRRGHENVILRIASV